MKTTITCLLLCLILASCKKSEDAKNEKPDPVSVITAIPATGSLSGIISPAGAAKNISITTIINSKSQKHITIPKSDGSFLIDTLPAGNYSIEFSANETYTAPETMNVSVVADKKTEVGVVKFVKREVGYGSMTGTVSPAGAASQIQILVAGTIVKMTPDPISGKFTFDRLPEGAYQLYLLAADRFTAPVAGKVIVTKDAVSDAGIYKFESYGYSSTFNFKAGDTFREMPAKVTLIAGKLNIIANLATGNMYNAGAYESHSLTIKLANVTKPGTYIFAGNEDELSYSTGRYFGLNGPMGSGVRYSSRYSGGKAEVTITEIDAVHGTISGTFNATVTGIRSLPITNGVFKASYR